MLSAKFNQTMYNVIRKITRKHSYSYKGNQTKQCIMLSGISDQTMHTVIKEIKPNDV